MLIDVIRLSKKTCTKPIQCELKYATKDNFVGRIIAGYHDEVQNCALLTPKAAEALCQVQNFLNQSQQGLLIYDAYRPRRAVLDFIAWSKLPPGSSHELAQKTKHYPQIEKLELFELGYLSADSNHSYGRTVDLVLTDANDNALDMGAPFDYMDVKSHHSATASLVGEQAYKNRQILLQAMRKFGFEENEKEFWHYHFGDPRADLAQPLDVPISLNWEKELALKSCNVV